MSSPAPARSPRRGMCAAILCLEAITLGLRLVSGVDEPAFHDRFPGAETVRSTADELCERGWLVREGGWLRLSGDATFVANDVLCRFL